MKINVLLTKKESIIAVLAKSTRVKSYNCSFLVVWAQKTLYLFEQQDCKASLQLCQYDVAQITQNTTKFKPFLKVLKYMLYSCNKHIITSIYIIMVLLFISFVLSTKKIHLSNEHFQPGLFRRISAALMAFSFQLL